MTLEQAQELANETGKPWIIAPEWAGATGQPLANWTAHTGEPPSVRRLETKGFRLVLPSGTGRNDLIDRNELID